MAEKKPKPTCGIVMPISAMDGCSEAHWVEVMDVLSDAVDDAGFEANLVSNADEIGIIQKRIIQNLYENPLVICDVSGKNPNVMFELGLRLAFDKPTIIVKDDKTSYSFDTSPIEHLEYPRDLRFTKIVDFKETLTEKLKATHTKATSDSSYTTFLKHFGEFKVAKIDKKEVSGQELLLDELRSLRMSVRRLEGSKYTLDSILEPEQALRHRRRRLDFCLRGISPKEVDATLERIESHPEVNNARRYELSPGHFHIKVMENPGANEDALHSELSTVIPKRRPSFNRPDKKPPKNN